MDIECEPVRAFSFFNVFLIIVLQINIFEGSHQVNFTLGEMEQEMETSGIIIAPPIQGEWAIYNPPGHPELAYDFIAVDSNKSPYLAGGIVRYLISFISVENTFTWDRTFKKLL